MNILILITFLVTLKTCQCYNIKELFEKINKKVEEFNAVAAEIAWESSVTPGNTNLVYKTVKFQKENLEWQHRICDELNRLEDDHSFNSSQSRQMYLLCRGPKYTYEEARVFTSLYEELQSIYTNAKVCIPTEYRVSSNMTDIEVAIIKYLKLANDFQKRIFDWQDPTMFAVKNAMTDIVDDSKICLTGENEFQNLMSFSKNDDVLKWTWLVWREKVGPPMKVPFRKLVEIENVAARRNGYKDIGASWRDDLEMPNLRQTCRHLYEDIKPLYTLLHGVARFFLRREYGNIVPDMGPIPAHLLGNLWSQNWDTIADLILPKSIDLDEKIKNLNWTVDYMVKRAEDFYQSLGLPAMTDIFWNKSVLSRVNNRTKCHGAAADMFRNDDFRLMYCSGTTIEDFYVIHHELGHIQYYMAYKNQPALFRQANTALHEAIGDTIMYGVMTPQHLHRLGLINDSILYNTDTFIVEENITFIKKRSIDFRDKLINKHDHREKRSKLLSFVRNNGLKRNINTSDETKTHIIKERLINIKTKANNKKFQQKEDKEELTDTVLTKEERKTFIKNKRSIFNEFDTKKFNDNDESQNKEESNEIYTMNKLNHINLTTDEVLLLKQALYKIPQIPFSLLMDEYRWKYFEGGFSNVDLNNKFWKMAQELQGIAPPMKRGIYEFDIGAKFHIPDNTPYIRYFLSSFLQHQLFESVCKAAVFGRRGVADPLPDTITMNRCDIYGSKAAGKLLKDIMSRGHSQHWRQILQETTGQNYISASPLKRYYRHLSTVLKKLVKLHRIPIGW